MPQLAWIGYLSTVGVYGDHDGAWVDETSECRPGLAPLASMRVAAEKAWLALGERDRPCRSRSSGCRASTARAATPSSTSTNGTAKRLVKPGQVFNRIHVDDIAGALWHLADARPGGVFNVTDDQPAPPQDVVAYAAQLMGVEPPPEIAFETRRTVADGALLLWREQARLQRRDQGRRLSLPLSRLPAGARRHVGGRHWRGDGESDARSPMKRS